MSKKPDDKGGDSKIKRVPSSSFYLKLELGSEVAPRLP